MDEELPNQFKVCKKIYELAKTDRNGNHSVGVAYYTRLVKEFEGVLDADEVSDHLDYLFDLGIINGEWRVIDGMSTRVFSIADEAEGFVRAMVAQSS